MARDIKPGFDPWVFAWSVVAEAWIGLIVCFAAHVDGRRMNYIVGVRQEQTS